MRENTLPDFALSTEPGRGPTPYCASSAAISLALPQGSHASLLAKHPPTLPARPSCPPTRPQGLTIRQAIFSIQHAILHCSPRASRGITASPIYGFCKTVHKRLNGGDGGNASATAATNGTAPGGGGGAEKSGATAGAGARGECIVTTNG